jgi:hypothetical protein
LRSRMTALCNDALGKGRRESAVPFFSGSKKAPNLVPSFFIPQRPQEKPVEEVLPHPAACSLACSSTQRSGVIFSNLNRRAGKNCSKACPGPFGSRFVAGRNPLRATELFLRHGIGQPSGMPVAPRSDPSDNPGTNRRFPLVAAFRQRMHRACRGSALRAGKNCSCIR